MFKIGQKVICKDLRCWWGFPFGIEKGGIYEVENVIKCKCGETHLLLYGIDTGGLKVCSCNNDNLPTNSFLAWRFEPIKYDLISNKDVIKEMIVEKSDLPIKEPILN